MTTFDLLKHHRAEILALAEKHGVKNVRVFGSVARGEDRPDSDIDLLIDYENYQDPLDFVRFQGQVEQLMDRHVEVVMEDSLHWYIKDAVLAEARPV